MSSQSTHYSKYTLTQRVKVTLTASEDGVFLQGGRKFPCDLDTSNVRTLPGKLGADHIWGKAKAFRTGRYCRKSGPAS